MDYFQLDNWTETEAVIERAHLNTASLVLFSAGPAGKYIGPAIAKNLDTPKVVIDLGNASDHWLLEKFHKQTLEAIVKGSL